MLARIWTDLHKKRGKAEGAGKSSGSNRGPPFFVTAACWDIVVQEQYSVKAHRTANGRNIGTGGAHNGKG